VSFANEPYKDEPYLYRALLQTSPIRVGLFCKTAIFFHGSFAKELYVCRALFQKSLLLCGSLAKEPYFGGALF